MPQRTWPFIIDPATDQIDTAALSKLLSSLPTDRLVEVVQAALPSSEQRSAFTDGYLRQALASDHHSLFWGDRMLTIDKSMGFFDDPTFSEPWSKVRGAHIYDQYDNKQSIAWRMHTLVWSARQAMRLSEGAFVECGVFQGDMSYVVYHAAGLSGSGRQMLLFDSWEGLDRAKAGPTEIGFVDFSNQFYARQGLYEQVVERFRPYPEVSVFKGFLPEALTGRIPKRIAWLHIDLNSAISEVETLELLFGRVVPSGFIVLDAYGWKALRAQKEAEDIFFGERSYSVLELPTGQGLVVKRANVPRNFLARALRRYR